MRQTPGSTRVLFEQRMGIHVRQLRRGERLAPEAVPELNPNAAGLALGLLFGTTLLFVDRRRSSVVVA